MKPHARTVLVVEDDAAVAEIYQFALERAGYAVRIARDGVEGLRLATEILPDFVFLDIRMPNLDGIGVLRGLAANSSTSAIPTVMLSNFDDPALVKESLSLGAKQYLVKAGTDPSRLASLVARWIEKPGSQTAGDSGTEGEGSGRAL